MAAVKYSRLNGEVEPTQGNRRPFIVFATAVCFVIFFMLYLSSSERVTSAFSSDYSDQNVSWTDAGITRHSAGSSSTQAQSNDGVTTVSPDIYKKYAIYTKKCRIRDYNWKDPVILKKYFQSNVKMCPKNAKPFFFFGEINVTMDTTCVGVDEAILDQAYGLSIQDLKCTYKEAQRDTSYSVIDKHGRFGPKKLLNFSSCPAEEFIWIECAAKVNASNIFYDQPLMLPKVKPARKPLIPNYLGKKPLHVLVVGLDSVSRLNAHRQFPKTMKFLQRKKNLVELFGYSKIGVNSGPNQIPLLTGKKYNPAPGLQSLVKNAYFDNMTRFLWDTFGDMGYRTMFYEEQWIYGLFVYPSLSGFKVAPTEYWPRPMMQTIDKSELKKKGSGYWCIGPDFPAKHYLEYTYQTMKLLGPDRPLWSYSWLSETAHDDVNGGHRVDDYFHDFLVDMENDGILNNTALFFISDHGFRFGSFRKTELGRYEDMLPYGFILMPDQYYNDVPDALENLRANSRRLVTVYDIHATMLELSDMWSEGRTIRTSNGYSLLSNVIPGDRTCEDADIDFQFCSCFEPQPQDRKGTMAVSLADFVLNTANGIIKKNNATEKCFEWTIDSVDGFYRLSEGDDFTNMYKISIKTKPGAQFEATASYKADNRTWELLSSIDRTDWFSTHAKCVKASNYERYCYCR